MNISVTTQDLFVTSPMLALLFLSLIPLFIKVMSGNREPNAFSTLMYNFAGLTIATGITATISGARVFAFGKALVIDGLSVWSSYLILLSVAVVLMLAFDHVALKGRQFAEFCFLTMSSAIGMLTLIMANDFIVVFLGIETLSLCLYVMIAMSHEEVLAKEASFKYFILGSFASALFLYGVAFLYGITGSTYFDVVSTMLPQVINSNAMILIAIGLIFSGFAFKLSLFPFHAWAPDVYHGSPTPVTALMATAAKAATFICLIRVFDFEGLSETKALLNILVWIAALTMTVGNAGALMQTNLKRMLAYSSIAHSGYIFMGLIAAGFGSNFAAGAISVLFYLFHYTVVTLGAFALIAVLEKSLEQQISLDSLKGLGKRQPMVALGMGVLLLSLAGIPPTLGFFAKFTVFSSVIEQDMYWLAFWGVFNSVVAVYYYLRPIISMFMVEGVGSEPLEESQMTRMTVLLAAAFVVVAGIFSSPVIRAVQKTVLNLF